MADDEWPSRTYDDIVSKLSGVDAAVAHDLSTHWKNMATDVDEAASALRQAHGRFNDEHFWSGEGPETAQTFLSEYYKTVADSDTGLSAVAEKISSALTQDGDVLTQAAQVPQSHERPNSKATKEEWDAATEELRADAQRLYTSPLNVDRPNMSEFGQHNDNDETPTQPGGGDTGSPTGTGNTGAGSSGTQTPLSSDESASGDTTPQDLTSGEGQTSSGQGQTGSQGGSGTSSGTPSGGSGSGQGSGSGGFGSGGSGLPVGATTAAGYSPPGATGAGSGSPGATGPTPLRGGTGLPGGAVGGANNPGINAAAMGAAGVRGGGPMGMMGTGAAGRGGKGDDGSERKPPSFLVNIDNGNELIGPLPKASPGVIGDWSEQEDAEKRRQEKEVERYKSIGWNVKYR